MTDIENVHVVTGRCPDRALRVATACAAGHEPRITVTAHDANGVFAGGFLRLRDVRRLARALATGAARLDLRLDGAGVLPGGTVEVRDTGEGVVIATDGAAFGPVPRAAVEAICRDVVTWHRLLAPVPEPVG
jgi:hypothetical protein